MMGVGPFSDVARQRVLAIVDAMLREPDCCVSIARGVKWRNDFATGQRVAEPTDGKTLTIDVHGGAREVEETFDEQLRRLRDGGA